MKNLWKKILYALLILVGLAVVFNYNYLWQNVSFSLTEPVRMSREELSADMLFIPSLQIKAPIVYAEEKNETAFQAAVAKGVGHYPGTAKPGELGNVFIFGHSSDLPWSEGEYKTVFALLPRIEIGAKVYLTDSEGEEFAYSVIDKFVAEKTDTFLLDQYNYDKNMLTLQTSWPLGTALRRYIVIAEMD